MGDIENDGEQQLKLDLAEIKKGHDKAKLILKNIEELNIDSFINNFNEKKNLISVKENETKEILERVKNYEEQARNSDKISKTLVQQIKDDLQKVNENIKSMQIAYENFLEIKGKIDKSETEIQNLLENARQIKVSIDSLNTESQGLLKNIKGLFQKAQDQISQMQKAYDDFIVIRGKIEDGKTGLNVIFDSVQSFNNKSKTLHQEIQSFRDESSKLVEVIKSNKNESEKVKLEINTLFTESKISTDKNIDEIKKVTALITDTGFSSTFENRKRDIENNLYSKFSWKSIFFVSTILLIILVILPFTDFVDIDNDNIFRYLINRIFYASPLIFLIWFSSQQYSKERDFAEKYAFKASSAAAIRNHIEFLVKNFKDADSEKKILIFAKETFTKIYKEPYKTEDDEKVKKLEKRIEALEKDNSKKYNDDLDITKITKELTTTITDENQLAKIIKIITKFI